MADFTEDVLRRLQDLLVLLPGGSVAGSDRRTPTPVAATKEASL